MAKYILYAKKVQYYRKEITAPSLKVAEKRSAKYEGEDYPERLFEPTVEEFYITSIEENEDGQ